MNIDHTILTVITFVPLAGAVLLALLPDKGETECSGVRSPSPSSPSP